MKTRIEEIIQQHNEMYDAFKKLNEEIEGEQEPNFKKGEYISVSFDKSPIRKYICIVNGKIDESFIPYAGLSSNGQLTIGGEFGYYKDYMSAPATPEEIALLDSKLAEQGKRFDKEKLEIVGIEKPLNEKSKKDCYDCRYNNPWPSQCFDLVGNCHYQSKWEPKYKEPITGKLAIGWDKEISNAVIGRLDVIDCGAIPYYMGGSWYKNAILFEYGNQYEQFLKS